MKDGRTKLRNGSGTPINGLPSDRARFGLVRRGRHVSLHAESVRAALVRRRLLHTLLLLLRRMLRRVLPLRRDGLPFGGPDLLASKGVRQVHGDLRDSDGCRCLDASDLLRVPLGRMRPRDAVRSLRHGHGQEPRAEEQRRRPRTVHVAPSSTGHGGGSSRQAVVVVEAAAVPFFITAAGL